PADRSSWPGGRDRFDRLGPLLDLLAGDLAHLVVAQLVADVLLTVGDRGGQQPERSHGDLVAGLHRGRGPLAHLLLQRPAHLYTPSPCSLRWRSSRSSRLRASPTGSRTDHTCA